MEDKFYGIFYDTQYSNKNWKVKIKFLINDNVPAFLPKDKKYYTIGRFEDPETAAKAYDAFVREHNLANSINYDEDGNRILHKSRSLSEDEHNMVVNYAPFMSSKLIADHLGVSEQLIKNIRRGHKQPKAVLKETPVLILTTEEIFREVFE